MKTLVFIVALAMVGFVYSYFNNITADELKEVGSQVEIELVNNLGVFCNIESASVCVLAQNENDCKKLEGQKVDSCPLAAIEK